MTEIQKKGENYPHYKPGKGAKQGWNGTASKRKPGEKKQKVKKDRRLKEAGT